VLLCALTPALTRVPHARRKLGARSLLNTDGATVATLPAEAPLAAAGGKSAASGSAVTLKSSSSSGAPPPPPTAPPAPPSPPRATTPPASPAPARGSASGSAALPGAAHFAAGVRALRAAGASPVHALLALLPPDAHAGGCVAHTHAHTHTRLRGTLTRAQKLASR
jgi:hypothetical protein